MKISCFQNRVRFIFAFFVLLVLIIVVRLYFLQVVDGGDYIEKADRQYINASGDTFDRGSIFFKDK
ncbi:MAG: hypothetical protein WCG60_01460, partial [bacterium]